MPDVEFRCRWAEFRLTPPPAALSMRLPTMLSPAWSSQAKHTEVTPKLVYIEQVLFACEPHTLLPFLRLTSREHVAVFDRSLTAEQSSAHVKSSDHAVVRARHTLLSLNWLTE